jgi:transcriptional regulator with XRE-family HTH domain
MPRPLMLNETAPYAVKSAAIELGERIRLARKRRLMTLRQIAARAGIAYETARAVENGKLMTGIGAYFALVWALGLERELAQFMDPERDTEGKQLVLAKTPKRARPKTESADNDF